MKITSFLPLPAALLFLSGCQTARETNAEIDKGVHAPKRSMEMAQGVGTDSNIRQINDALSIIKAEPEGQMPASLEEAKRAVKVPNEMWIDAETGKPLEYDPATGTVRKAP